MQIRLAHVAEFPESNYAEFRCPGCGEWFTEFDLEQKAAKDDYYCKNCGGSDFVKCVGDWSSKECFVCEFENCPHD